MATKKDWLAYLIEVDKYQKAYRKYEKDLKKWVKELPDGEVNTQSSGPGSNPPTPPPPPPPPNS